MKENAPLENGPALVKSKSQESNAEPAPAVKSESIASHEPGEVDESKDSDVEMGEITEDKPEKESTPAPPISMPKEDEEMPEQEAKPVEPGASLLPPSLDEPVDDDEEEDELDFDEEYFAESEMKFVREIDALEAKKPPALTEDPAFVKLAVRLQILKMMADDALPEAFKIAKKAVVAEPEPIETEKVDPVAQVEETVNEAVERVLEATTPPKAERIVPVGLPTPKIEELDDSAVPEPDNTHLAETVKNTVPTPPLESLPFLSSGPPTPFSLQQSVPPKEQIQLALRNAISGFRSESAERNAALRQQYAKHYRTWRLTVMEMDREKAESKARTSIERSPAPPTPAPAQPEGRRGRGIVSELDLQNVIELSKQTAKEEMFKRQQEGATKPDYDREAEIPDMLSERERKANIFQDTNQLIDPNIALEAFHFTPANPQFTEEEMRLFKDVYATYPKQWGLIADSIPDRDFQACIQHYYFTKEKEKYKLLANKRAPKGRRAVKKSAARPKSNALMADLGVNDNGDAEGDEDTPAVAVTDTGRPRRAAAPTFGGDAGDDSAAGERGGRRGASAKGTAAGEVPVEKPKRGRGGGPGRGGRRPRGGARQQSSTAVATGPQNLVPTAPDQVPVTQPLRAESEAPVQPAPSLPPTEIPPPVIAQPGQLPYGLDGPSGMPSEPLQLQPHPAVVARPRVREPAAFDAPPPAPPQSSVPGTVTIQTASPVATVPLQREPVVQQSIDAAQALLPLQPSSYWSVPEQKRLPELLAHYGRDFEMIANKLGTKTTVMVS